MAADLAALAKSLASSSASVKTAGARLDDDKGVHFTAPAACCFVAKSAFKARLAIFSHSPPIKAWAMSPTAEERRAGPQESSNL